jgi:hypothetical protein
MQKVEAMSFASDQLVKLLGPTCQHNGVSLKAVSSDLDAGTVRSAMALVFVESVSCLARQNGFIASRQVGIATASAYILLLAASLKGSKSIEWLAKLVEKALDNKLLSEAGTVVELSQVQYTSYSAGVWQYRMPLTLKFPYSSDQTYYDQAVDSSSWLP